VQTTSTHVAALQRIDTGATQRQGSQDNVVVVAERSRNQWIRLRDGCVPGTTPAARGMKVVAFADGLGRVIQTKKDITLDDGSGNTTTGMSVSGPPVFDARGRLFQQGQPSFAASATPATTYVAALPVNNPTQYKYDVLGRLRQEQHPDSAAGGPAITNISYQIGYSPQNGKAYIVKLSADPEYNWDQNYHYRAEYRTVRDDVELVVEPNQINGAVTNVSTSYTNDPLGRVLTVTDFNGNTTYADYDSLGELVDLTSPDAGFRQWQYCVGGHLCAEQAPKNTGAIKYTYDHDRLKKIDYPSDTDVTYTYGAPGDTGGAANRVKTRTDEAGQVTYTYDALGNVASEAALLIDQRGGTPNCFGNTKRCYPTYTTSYTWDSFARLIDVTIPGTASVGTQAETIRYGYDASGAVASAWGKVGTAAAKSYVTHVGYNEFDERVYFKAGNGVYTQHTYYPDTRRLGTTSTTIQDIAGQPARQAQALNFYYDLLGNVTGRAQWLSADTVTTDVVPVGGYATQWFYYDPASQLTHADLYSQATPTEYDYGSVSLSYDAIGNIIQKDQTDGGDIYDSQGNYLYSFTGLKFYSLSPSYFGTAFNASPHAPSRIDEDRLGAAATTTYGYDADGNVTTITRDDGTPQRQIAWTDSDRVRNIKDGTTTISQALYQADGTRTHNKTAQGETLYVNQYLTIRNGNLPTKHVYLGNARVASKVESSGSLSNTYWYHSDNLQSTQYVTSANQRVVQHLEYFPAGEIFREQPNPPPTDIAHGTTFTGKELDPSGYYYFGARYYEPLTQMWLSPDPILAHYMKGSPNGGIFAPTNLGLYTYSHNNPVTLRDPDGNADGKYKWLHPDDGYREQGGPPGWRIPFGGCSASCEDGGKKPPAPPPPDSKSAPSGNRGGRGSAPRGNSPRETGGEGTGGGRDGSGGAGGGSARPAEAESGAGAKRGPKPPHEGPHNQKVDDVAAGKTPSGVQPGEEVVAGGGQLPERVIPTPGGAKGARRPDVLIRDQATGNLRGVNVGRADKNGNPIPREQSALDDLNNKGGIPTTFEPYKPAPRSK
jgi:RHS repeat-associated protein